MVECRVCYVMYGSLVYNISCYTRLYICAHVHPCISVSTYMTIRPSTYHIYRYIWLFVYLSICLAIWVFVCRSISHAVSLPLHVFGDGASMHTWSTHRVRAVPRHWHTGVCEQNTPLEISFKNTKSGAGEQFSLLFCKTNFCSCCCFLFWAVSCYLQKRIGCFTDTGSIGPRARVIC